MNAFKDYLDFFGCFVSIGLLIIYFSNFNKDIILIVTVTIFIGTVFFIRIVENFYKNQLRFNDSFIINGIRMIAKRNYGVTNVDIEQYVDPDLDYAENWKKIKPIILKEARMQGKIL